jgi:DNA-directed RNA polymerase subunit beta'
MQDKSQFIKDFSAIRLRIASPEDIRRWSYGEVTRPETINYRTQKPEKDGLFSERIFGPTKDWECYCGKYKKIRYRGIVCDKCGVEVTRAIVRRERMGHIELAAPVSHSWFLRSTPSKVGLFLDMSVQNLEKVIYFGAFIVTEVKSDLYSQVLNELKTEFKTERKGAKNSETLEETEKAYTAALNELENLKPLAVLSETAYHDLSLKYGHVFEANIGAEAIRLLLEQIDLKNLQEVLEKEIVQNQGVKRERMLRRLKLVKNFLINKMRPEWMMPIVLPIIPPDLRPMVPLDGGRFATSDLNDLYRRIINRNNRLRQLLDLNAPEVIVRNEKRMLQEAVDALIDNNARKGKVTLASTGQRRPLKSLADMLRGKEGRFRQNLLGKRTDYSGRSVIVVGPDLNLDQCGLPKKMALELFKPFLIGRLIRDGLVHNIRSASRFIESNRPEIWQILEEIVANALVLLNRAPTLHRLGIQAFHPVLIEGRAIQIHPFVCPAFNADFDGDQMAVHVLLTEEAREEARTLMLSSKNLLKPATGDPVVTPAQDFVWGLYYLTKDSDSKEKKPKALTGPGEAKALFAMGVIKVNDEVNLPVASVKALRNKTEERFFTTTAGRVIFNEALPKSIPFYNEAVGKSVLQDIFKIIIEQEGFEAAAALLDVIKKLSLEHLTRSGNSWGIEDLPILKEKGAIIAEAEKKVEEIRKLWEDGYLTLSEKKNKTAEVWIETKEKTVALARGLFAKGSSVFSMVSSQARGSWTQLTQIVGMKGLVTNPAGEIIELPVKSSFQEGFSVLEYFISSHGARKGLSDIALRTANAGYLTRRLVDVAQDVVVKIEDCGDKEGFTWTKQDSEELGKDFGDLSLGRFLTHEVRDKEGKVVVKKGVLVTPEMAREIRKAAPEKLCIRSAICCKLLKGVCQKCYGYDLGKNEAVALGAAVGIIAAQSIGEPGTQLTMRTFHTGGVVGLDITQGLPRVEELFEARPPKQTALVASQAGEVEMRECKVPYQKVIVVKDKKGETEYPVSPGMVVWAKTGDQVEKGDQLTEGSLNLQELFRLKGKEAALKYIIKEIQNIYSSQGQKINGKHLEVIARQMFSRVYIIDAGDTNLMTGEIVEKIEFEDENKRIEQKGAPAKGEELLLGITRVALTTRSFLSAASFQETSRVLTNAAVAGDIDRLEGLKENVIIGRKIPAGTGFRS